MSETSANKQMGDNSKTARFKILADEYARLLATANVRCRTYADPRTPLFAAADDAVKDRAISFLEGAVAVFEATIAEGRSIRDTRYVLWRTLTRLRLVPSSDIFDQMRDDDVIEIFNIEPPCHIAWNLRLMELVSFTVEQLLCCPWWELGSRPPEIMQAIHSAVAAIASGHTNETLHNVIPKHILTELNSEQLLRFEVDIRCVSPLRQDGRNVAFMGINRSRIL